MLVTNYNIQNKHQTRTEKIYVIIVENLAISLGNAKNHKKREEDNPEEKAKDNTDKTEIKDLNATIVTKTDTWLEIANWVSLI